eukprot:12995088-Alexandrium_andersonii.AAC.1
MDHASDEELPDVSAGAEAGDLRGGPGAEPIPNVPMDVDADAVDAPPASYRIVDLTEPPVPYAGDPTAPVGE